MKCEEKIGEYCMKAIKYKKYTKYRECNKCCLDYKDRCDNTCEKVEGG